MGNNHNLNHQVSDSPIIPASQSIPEITPRVIVLGVILTIILAAANAFLGLKLGTTVSASIPAAVISMGILQFFRHSNILENTMVQTMASVGESLTSGIAFILPALIILHAWTEFNYWETVATGLVGGILGVLFTIPLRRALLIDKSLRYPEGIAIGNVLRASANKEKSDLKSLVVGGGVGGLIALFQSGFQILTGSFHYWVKTSVSIFGFGIGLSPALIAAGYIVGINVALSLFVGILIGWIIGVPVLTMIYGIPDAATTTDMAISVWRSHIRYIGVGVMLVGGMWTLTTLIKPIFRSLMTSFVSIRQTKSNGQIEIRAERDIPMNYVLWAVLLLLIPIFFLITAVIIPPELKISSMFRGLLGGFSAIYILIGGFIFCSIMAYFAGLIGSTNSPVSGLLVCSLLIVCLMLLPILNTQTGFSAMSGKELIGVVVAIGSSVIIGSALSISNDTMQDLKVGQIVGATPWKQQVMLVLGVVVSAFVIPPILNLLYNAYGIGGVFPRPNMDKTQMLAAPQAGLMAAVAQGVFSHNLAWGLIAVGAVIAVICIFFDELLKRYGTRLPVLAVGLGIYLPVDSSFPFVIGGILSYLVHIRLQKRYPISDPENVTKMVSHAHRGLLLTCGIVAGASVMGVLLAIPFAIKQNTSALKLMPEGMDTLAGILSLIVTFFLCVWIYRVVMRKK